MRIMALDYGDARTGIAVSDAMGILAGDAWTVHEPNTLKVAEIIADMPSTEPMDRSMLPVMQTMPWPMPTSR